MDKQKIVTINEESYRLNIPTIGSRIQVQGIVASLTRGMQNLLAISADQDSQDAINTARKVARLQVCVEKLDKKGMPDYSFSFTELDDSEESLVLINKLDEAMEDFIKSFRK